MWVKENSCCDNNDYCKLAEDLFWDPEGWKRHVMHHSSRLKCTWKEEWWDVRIRELLGSRQLMEIGQGSTTTRPIIGFSKETRLKIAADFSNSKSSRLSSKQHFLKVGFQNEGEWEVLFKGKRVCFCRPLDYLSTSVTRRHSLFENDYHWEVGNIVSTHQLVIENGLFSAP